MTIKDELTFKTPRELVEENSSLHARMLIYELMKSKTGWSNVALMALPQSGKDLFAQYVVDAFARNILDKDRPLLVFNILCDSNNETKNQSINRRLDKNSLTANLYQEFSGDFALFAIQRNDLDGFFNNGKSISDVGFIDNDGKHQQMLSRLTQQKLRQMLTDDNPYIITIFDEFHQHIHANASIDKFHDLIGISPKKVNKEKPVFYITATGSALYTSMYNNKESFKIHNHVMTPPEGYYGIEDFIKDGRYYDWELFSGVDSIETYANIFEFIKPSVTNAINMHVGLRCSGLRQEDQARFDELADKFCEEAGLIRINVDVENKDSVKLFKDALSYTPSGGKLAKYNEEEGGKKYLFVLKQMFGCGQTIPKQRLLWWITPPAHKNNPTSTQRENRVSGMDAEFSPVSVIGPQREAQAYNNAYEELKKGNLEPMVRLDNQLVDSKSEIDYGWVYRLVDKKDVQLREGYGWHHLSGMASRTTARRGTIDISQQIMLALKCGESSTNLINTNLVGGTKNVEYVDPQSGENHQCYSIVLNGPNPNDVNDYWSSRLSLSQGQVLVAFKGRPMQKIKSAIKVNEKMLMSSY